MPISVTDMEENLSFSHVRESVYTNILNNYSTKARWILSNNTRDEVEEIIRQYSPSLGRIIVLV